ncbi:MAG: hypothetical protein ABI347_04615 [Nitrososphaera sp.]|jgi:hypothetical protein
MAKAEGEIMDISDTPDVAVWAKAGRKTPADAVKEPSKVASLSLHVKGRQAAVDAANEKEIAKAQGYVLTDESGYGRQE